MRAIVEVGDLSSRGYSRAIVVEGGSVANHVLIGVLLSEEEGGKLLGIFESEAGEASLSEALDFGDCGVGSGPWWGGGGVYDLLI